MAWRKAVFLVLGVFLFSACSLVQLNRSRVQSGYKRAGLLPHDIKLSSGMMHYYDGGSGPPVLLVHGFAFGALETWEKQVPLFSKSYRVIAPDLYWFGRSVPAGVMDDAEQQARALSELLTQLGISRSAVIGVSFGGYVAIELGLTHPEQVDKLVLVDAAGLAPTAQESQQVAANFGGKQRIADLLIPKDPDELGRLIKTLFYKPRCIPKCVLREILHQEFWQNKEAKRQICERMDAEGGFLAPAALRGISAPTLLIWGRYDPLILPSIGARLAASIPSSRIVYFEQSKHSPMLEEAKRFNTEVLGFLSSRSTR